MRRFTERRTMRGAALAGAVVMASGALAGCDDFRDVAVTNDCGSTVVIAEYSSGSQRDWMTLDEDETAVASSSSGPFDVLVREPESNRWQVRVAWEDMEEREEYVRAVELAGDLCP